MLHIGKYQCENGFCLLSLSKLLNDNSKVLIIWVCSIGAFMNKFQEVWNSKSLDVQSIDIYFSPNTKAIAYAHFLSYKRNSFYIIIQDVVEMLLILRKFQMKYITC